MAGLPGAIASVPDGMAASVLVGVSPVHGLYASFAGPIAGGLTSSTRLMVITTTSAAALAAGSALSDVDEQDRSGALAVMTLLVGALLVAAAVAGVGRYVRFVSHSVMLGFLTGVSMNIVFGQIPDLLGVDASGEVALGKAVDALTHPAAIGVAALLTGLAALALQVALGHTRLSTFSAIIALIVPTTVVLLVGGSVVQVSDSGDIPAGFPPLGLPDFTSLTPSVLTGAVAVAAIILVQGAGVADAAPNRDGTRSNTNADVAAQGWGNVAASAFSGQPVGGSVGQTALNITAGARTRWASIYSGLWMLVILVALSQLVGKVAMPTLAAVLIFAGIGSLKPAEVVTMFRAGRTPQIAFVTTFVSTLLLPVAAAVGIGVALSLLLQLNQESIDLKVVRLQPDGGGRFIEAEAPRRLRDDDVIVLDVYGSLFYAGAKTLQLRLPDPTSAKRASVIVRLRGRTTLGSTFLTVIGDYAARLDAGGGRLFLSGVDDAVADRWERTGLPQTVGSVRLFRAGPVVGESTYDAFLGASSHEVHVDREAP